MDTPTTEPAPLAYLGWANDWKEDPEVVVNCHRLKHKPTDVDVGPPNRGIEHVVTCRECGYYYKYDSSD